MPGNSVEMGDLVVGQHIAGWICRSGDTEGCSLRTDIKTGEIHMVLKQIVLKQLDLRACGGKQVVTDAYIPVANILRRQGKMD